MDLLETLGEISPKVSSVRAPLDPVADLECLIQNLRQASPESISYMLKLNDHLAAGIKSWVSPVSDLVNDDFAKKFGFALLVHHANSPEPLTKIAFEVTMVKVMLDCDRHAERGPMGNPGHDIKVGNQRFSLKTQADKGIIEHQVHISKMMELGKGEWTDRQEDFDALKTQVKNHIGRYERILVLRRLKSKHHHRYELLEIPKELLLEAMNFQVSISVRSKQKVKSGSIIVPDLDGSTKFKMHFDGGGERKLQLQQLQKCHCIVHATWETLKREVI